MGARTTIMISGTQTYTNKPHSTHTQHTHRKKTRAHSTRGERHTKRQTPHHTAYLYTHSCLIIYIFITSSCMSSGQRTLPRFFRLWWLIDFVCVTIRQHRERARARYHPRTTPSTTAWFLSPASSPNHRNGQSKSRTIRALAFGYWLAGCGLLVWGGGGGAEAVAPVRWSLLLLLLAHHTDDYVAARLWHVQVFHY